MLFSTRTVTPTPAPDAAAPTKPLRSISPWAALLTLGGLLLTFLWGSTVIGVAIVLSDAGAVGWALVLLFGALPLVCGAWLVDRWISRSRSRRDDEEARPRPQGARTPKQDDALEQYEPVPTGGRPNPPPASDTDLGLVDDLTQRELEVLQLLSSGRTNGEIARDLFVTTGTVKSHVNSIYRKLGARNRTEAADRARRLDLVDGAVARLAPTPSAT
jgi:DNA-binding CsgD family transcriptional regulator